MTPSFTTPLHALIIDDNSGNTTVLGQLLQLEGAACTSVNNPHQITSVLANIERADMIFLDLEMPGIDGYTVLEQIKSDARFEGVPVIAYTVHTSEITEARRFGFDGFIGKPLDADRFPEQFARIVRGESVWTTI